MSIYDIIIAPDSVLKEQAQPVQSISSDVQKQMDKMVATMYDAAGIGLAANQVGLLNRVIVLDVNPESWEYGETDKNGILTVKSKYRSGEKDEQIEEEKESNTAIIMANPEIIYESEQRSVFEEGCLSIPGQYGIVERPAKVRVKYLDYNGKEQELDAEGLLSHCVQHEIDHLNGVLFVDYLSSLKRNMIIRKMQKLKKQQIL